MPGAIVSKTIKPSRLKDDAMRLRLLNAMRKAGTQIKHDFEATTKTWEHKVVFEELISLTGPGPVVLVATNDEIYGYVNNGTEPHEIWAGVYTGKSDKTRLAFSSDFVPKTKPGIIDSGPGRRGAVDTFVPMVMHPGQEEPRNFDKTIQKKREPWFKRQMESAMGEARQASGHAA